MQTTLLYLLFLTTCGFALETSLPDSVDNNLLDVKKLPPTEEDPAPNPKDGDISANVEDLQRQLIAEQAKNRDLNQTISDILEEMEDMKKNIMRNEEKIIDNQSSVLLLSRDVDDLTDDVATVQRDVAVVQDDVAAVQDDVIVVAADVERNSADITTLATFGTWCGEQDRWNTVGTITYDSLTFSASNNMNYASTPLDINTGIFTVPVSGAWRLTYSLESRVESGDYNICYLYLNGDRLDETEHETYSGSGVVWSTSGRVVTVEASAGDKIEIRTIRIDGNYYRILYCAEYIPKM